MRHQQEPGSCLANWIETECRKRFQSRPYVAVHLISWRFVAWFGRRSSAQMRTFETCEPSQKPGLPCERFWRPLATRLGARLPWFVDARFGHQTGSRIEYRRGASAAARRQVCSFAHDDGWRGQRPLCGLDKRVTFKNPSLGPVSAPPRLTGLGTLPLWRCSHDCEVALRGENAGRAISILRALLQHRARTHRAIHRCGRLGHCTPSEPGV